MSNRPDNVDEQIPTDHPDQTSAHQSIDRGPSPTPTIEETEAISASKVGEPEAPETTPAPATDADMECGRETAHPEASSKPSTGRIQIPGYEIIQELGRGGMGVVYKAKHLQLDRIVALKMILAGDHASDSDILRFASEARAVAALQHPNIVQIHDIGDDEGRPYCALELCSGGSLEDQLEQDPWEPAQAAALIQTLAQAIQAVHEKNIIHRDLKPGNVLLDENGSPKITDFGLARRMDEAGQTQSGSVMGTPFYMAPEQASGKKDQIGPGVDIYALGAILYECITGRPPFVAVTALETILQVINSEPVSPRDLQPDIPKDLETICLKCLEKDPQKRYASAQGLSEDLRRFQDGEPIAARPIGQLERGWRWCCRNALVAALGGVLFFVLLGGLTGMTLLWLDADHHRLLVEKERDLARQEKKRADGNLATTRKALNSYLQKVVENEHLKKGNFHTLRKELLETAVPIFEDLVRQKTDDHDLEQERAQTYARLAEIHRELGEYEKAVGEHAQAAKIWTHLAEQYPDNPEHRHQQATSQNQRGVALLSLGRRKAALEAFLQLQSLRTSLAKEHPEKMEYRKAEAVSHNNVGAVRQLLGQFTEAEKAYRQAARLQEALTQDYPEEISFRVEHARTLANLCFLLHRLGRRGGADLSGQKACALMEQIVKDSPTTGNYRELLVRSLLTNGLLYSYQGRLERAREYLSRGIDDAENLKKRFPAVPGYSELCSIGQRVLGSVLGELEKNNEAIKLLEGASVSLSSLAEKFPTVPSYQLELSITKTHLGRIVFFQGRKSDALQLIQDALTLQNSLTAAHPMVSDFQKARIDTLCEQSTLLLETGEAKMACSSIEKALEAQKKLTSGLAALPEYRHRFARILRLQAICLRKQQLPRASELLRRSLQLFDELVTEFPEIKENVVEQAAAWTEQAIVLREAGRISDALQQHEKSVRSLNSLKENRLRPPGLERILQAALKEQALTEAEVK